MKSFPAIFLLAILLPGGAPVSAEDPDLTYREANAAFETKDYEKAIALYESLVAGNQAAALLYLNLGAAHFRNGSPGKAALWFRRAAHLDPSMPELKQNFEFLRRTQGLLEFGESEWQRFLLRRSPGPIRWGAWVFLWTALLTGWATVFSARMLPYRPLLIFGALLAGGLSATLFSIHRYRAENLAPVNFATVIVPDSAAQVSPAPDSGSVIDLPEGSEVRIIEDTGPWLYAEIPGDLRGWVHHTTVEKNWPIPARETPFSTTAK